MLVSDIQQSEPVGAPVVKNLGFHFRGHIADPWRACMLSRFTLFDPMDYSLPGSFVHGILQARILEWVAMLSSRGSSQPWPNWIPISSTILLRLSSSVIQKVAQWYHCLLHIFPKATSSSICLDSAKSQLPCPAECGPEGGVPSGRGSQLSSRPRFQGW